MAKEVMGLSEIISSSFKEYREGWKTFLGILVLLSFIPAIIFFIVEMFWLKVLYGSTLSGDPTKIVSGFFSVQFLLLVLVGIVMVIIAIWMQASIIYNVIFKKKSMGFRESIAGGSKYFWKFLGLMLLIGLIFVLPIIILIMFIGLATYFGTISNMGLTILFALLAIIGFIAYFIFVLFFGIRWLFSIYILIGENKGVTDSLRTSSGLVKGRWWKTFGYLLLFLLIIWGISIVFSIPAMIINWIITFSTLGAAGLAAASSTSGNLSSLSSSFTNITIITMGISLIFSMLSQIIIVPLGALFVKNFYLSWKSSNK